jgi:hypothetical protein
MFCCGCCSVPPLVPPRSAFAGFPVPAGEVIVVAVRWHLRYGLSYRDVEELLAERGSRSTTSPSYRWVKRFTPTPPGSLGTRRVAGGLSTRGTSTECGATSIGRRRAQPGLRCCSRPGGTSGTSRRPPVLRPGTADAKVAPNGVVTDAAPVYLGVVEELLPSAWHHLEQYANNPVEADQGQLKRRLRPMPGLQNDRTAHVMIAGRALLQNPASRPVRTRSGCPPRAAGRRSVHRTRPSDLAVAWGAQNVRRSRNATAPGWPSRQTWPIEAEEHKVLTTKSDEELPARHRQSDRTRRRSDPCRHSGQRRLPTYKRTKKYNNSGCHGSSSRTQWRRGIVQAQFRGIFATVDCRLSAYRSQDRAIVLLTSL